MKSLFLIQIFFYLLGGACAFFSSRNEAIRNAATLVSAILAGGVGVVYSLLVLWTGRAFSLEFHGFSLFGNLQFTVDPLSGFFIFSISLLSVATSIFAIGYTRSHPGKYKMRLSGFFYHLFILAMILVVSSQNAFYFLIFWEVMSLGSYVLVILEHENPQALRAGILYLIMTHIGTALILAGFLLLFIHSGSFSFEAFRLHQATLPPGLKNAIFFMALAGFGTKAGLIPFHIWLPEAHPAAPSHVSALMSGVMIKTAIYGLLRFFFNFLGEIPAWWGPVVLAVAMISTLLGILYALMEHDLKRLLAFSSIENIGIILLGVGMALLFASMQQWPLAIFSLTAALYHTLNHAAFKGLLFLSAGSVLYETHTPDMESLGGLIKKMPFTAFCFLVGAVAISALPPLNGFVSEWMTFIALLAGCEGPAAIRFFSPILASLLGLAGALAATCFVKAFGIVFLGSPRSACVEEAGEVPLSMKSGMAVMAMACFALALGAPWIVQILGTLSASLVGKKLETDMFTQTLFLQSPSGLSQISPTLIAIALGSLILGAFIGTRFIFGKAFVKQGPSWDCGLPSLVSRMQYTATGFSKPLRRIFSFLYQPARRVELEDEGHEMLRTAERFESKITHIFDDFIYKPISKMIADVSEKAKRIQTGHIQLYLSYIFITLILLLLFGIRR
ncbi:MAG: hydrogenase 4 subunit B [Candidatus Omnitrophica bacterium]|nr:hydrogenase 4 subunit B [Candidatus Omnitrophota bacterium]